MYIVYIYGNRNYLMTINQFVCCVHKHVYQINFLWKLQDWHDKFQYMEVFIAALVLLLLCDLGEQWYATLRVTNLIKYSSFWNVLSCYRFVAFSDTSFLVLRTNAIYMYIHIYPGAKNIFDLTNCKHISIQLSFPNAYLQIIMPTRTW